MIALAYGARPLALQLPDGLAARVIPPPRPPGVELDAALSDALAHPTGARPLAEVATARTRAVVVLPGDGDAPRAALFAAARRALAAVPDDRITLAVAGPCPPPLDRLGLSPELLRRHRVVRHDGADPGALVEVGRTSRGTRLRVARCVAEADLVVVAGPLRPHPYAGYTGGACGIFPGMGSADGARDLLRLADDPAAALGRADRNPYRDDLEEAARRLGRDTFALAALTAGGALAGAVAGDLVLAHREGVRRLRPWVEVEAAREAIVVASASLPASGTLRRAARLLAPAGALLAPGGVLVLVAECPDGLGDGAGARDDGAGGLPPPLRRCLPPCAEVLLVSSLEPGALDGRWARAAPSLARALEEARRRAGSHARALVLPDATDLVPVGAPPPAAS